ncbi:histidine biosynthesis family protein [Synechococcus sp. WH 8103]|nr:histidine biosynthesis family protein [Synechococcus sp. WH 8103]
MCAGALEAIVEVWREESGQEVLAWMEVVHKYGAGEIYLPSVDQDGTCVVPDREW